MCNNILTQVCVLLTLPDTDSTMKSKERKQEGSKGRGRAETHRRV